MSTINQSRLPSLAEPRVVTDTAMPQTQAPPEAMGEATLHVTQRDCPIRRTRYDQLLARRARYGFTY